MAASHVVTISDEHRSFAGRRHEGCSRREYLIIEPNLYQ